MLSHSFKEYQKQWLENSKELNKTKRPATEEHDRYFYEPELMNFQNQISVNKITPTADPSIQQYINIRSPENQKYRLFPKFFSQDTHFANGHALHNQSQFFSISHFSSATNQLDLENIRKENDTFIPLSIELTKNIDANKIELYSEKFQSYKVYIKVLKIKKNHQVFLWINFLTFNNY
ncbi:MAG: hypothetical protein H2069_08770 [Legionella sp.]|nr:hypothetical protein [Legionella sp.]